MKWKYSTVAILFLLLSSVSQVNGVIINRIAAIVNDDVVTTHEIDEKLAQPKDKLATMSETDVEQARLQVLNSLIEEKLVNQRIKELNIQVSDAELEAAIQDILKSNNLTREQLEESLVQQGMTFEKYRENLRMELLRYRLLSQDVRKKIMIKEQDVLDYFRDHIDEFRQEPFLRLGYLNFEATDLLEREKVKVQAQEVRKQLQSGTSFEEVLRSLATESHVTGGDLGKLGIEDLSPIYADAVRDLPQGGVSEVLETPGSLRILIMEERSAGEVKKFDQVRSSIKKKLTNQRMEERFKDWAENLKKEARIEILL